MADRTWEQLSAAYGRLILQMPFVWVVNDARSRCREQDEWRLHLPTLRAPRRLHAVQRRPGVRALAHPGPRSELTEGKTPGRRVCGARGDVAPCHHPPSVPARTTSARRQSNSAQLVTAALQQPGDKGVVAPHLPGAPARREYTTTDADCVSTTTMGELKLRASSTRCTLRKAAASQAASTRRTWRQHSIAMPPTDGASSAAPGGA